MIQDSHGTIDDDTAAQVRDLAEQFRSWLARSLENPELVANDEGLLGLHTLITMKGDDFMSLTPDETGRWVVGMSAFLGECIRTRLGGQYFRSGAQGFGLRLPNERELYPIRWVQSQLSGGENAPTVVAQYEKLLASLAEEL